MHPRWIRQFERIQTIPSEIFVDNGTQRTTLNASLLTSDGTLTISNASLTNVTGVTQEPSDDSTKLATTAFVKDQEYATVTALTANISAIYTSLASFARQTSVDSIYTTLATCARQTSVDSIYTTLTACAKVTSAQYWWLVQTFGSGIVTNSIKSNSITADLILGENMTTGSTQIASRGFVNGTFNSVSAFNIRSTSDPNCGDGLAFLPVSGYNYIVTFYGTGGNLRGKIDGNGSSVSYDTSSDRRLKTNIQPMAPMMDKIMALKPSEYTWIADQEQGYGFIAQEVHQVFPELRSRHPKYCENVDEPTNCETGEPMYYGVDYGKFTPYIVKAMQEMKLDYDAKLSRYETQVSQLETRLLALEQRV